MSYTWLCKSVFQIISLICSRGGPVYYYTLRTMKLLGGYIGFTPSVHLSVCPSVCPASHVRSVAPTILVGSISYLYILSSNFRSCGACKVFGKLQNLNFRQLFKICNFVIVLFWLGIWCGVISECRHSSCSNYISSALPSYIYQYQIKKNVIALNLHCSKCCRLRKIL